ncbi:hypothetical protein [Mycolicibacterium sp. lyk4-40-TYG-92]|uniref:hypothetical protein n=1 Tax=Mycolicibacterium sp. lyk4-40-TYG-92 TaxID=3040295 RepID=UPI00254A0DE3|nr:hypothetical protein [Mycolicibacterium sp. lyk4-40-TYG-92]
MPSDGATHRTEADSWAFCRFRAFGRAVIVAVMQTPDTAVDLAEVMHRIPAKVMPSVGADVVKNLVYAVGFIRVVGGPEEAAPVDRAGKGKIHRRGTRRAVDTAEPFAHWMRDGASSAATRESVARVVRMHDHYGKAYAMPNEAFLHGIALFTLGFDEIFQIVGLDVFTDSEKAAQVAHWRAIGEQMRIRGIPDTWTGMQQMLRDYEHDPQWYGFSVEGHRCAESLINQFNERWLPRALHPVGRAVILSLEPDHVLAAVGERKPPTAVVWMVRRLVRAALLIQLKAVPQLKTWKER